jgi:hypothetical protein
MYEKRRETRREEKRRAEPRREEKMYVCMSLYKIIDTDTLNRCGIARLSQLELIMMLKRQEG